MPAGLFLAGDVQRPDVQHHDAGDHPGQQEVQGEEAVDGRVADRVAAPEQALDGVAHDRDRGQDVGDNGGAPEAHLAPRQGVAEEGRGHHQQVDDDAEDVEHLARGLVGAVIQRPEDVHVDGHEEHRGAVGVGVAQEPTVVHVAHDVLDGVEGLRRRGLVMHGEPDAGDDLHAEHGHEDRAEGPEVVQVPRHRERDERGVHQPDQRQAALEPLRQAALGHVGVAVCAHEAIRLFKCLDPRRVRGRQAAVCQAALASLPPLGASSPIRILVSDWKA